MDQYHGTKADLLTKPSLNGLRELVETSLEAASSPSDDTEEIGRMMILIEFFAKSEFINVDLEVDLKCAKTCVAACIYLDYDVEF